MVLFDTNVLCLLLHPDADVPNDPKTGKPLTNARERIDYLRDRLQDEGIRIVIPTPVISEFLTFADAEYLVQIAQSVHFEIASFDQRAAVESAIALRRAIKSPQGKKLGSTSPWQKIKVDRQIVAIGKVNQVSAVYSTDDDVLTLARESGLTAIHAADLPEPPLAPEHQYTLEDMQAMQPASDAEAKPSSEPLADGEVKDAQLEPSATAPAAAAALDKPAAAAPEKPSPSDPPAVSTPPQAPAADKPEQAEK